MPSKLQIGLIASLALNAALLGVVGGRMFVNASAPPPQEASNLPAAGGYRPVSASVQAAWAQLPQEDRLVLREQFKELGAATASTTVRLRDSAGRIAEIARAEPYDGAALQDQVVIYRHLQAGLQQRVDDVLVGHLEEMPPEARETAARGLLTPYYAWMRPASRPASDDGTVRADGEGPVPASGDQPGE